MRLRSSFTAVVLGAAGVSAAAQSQTTPPPSPAQMSRPALEAEVAAARPMIERGGVRAGNRPGCTSAERRQLDYWLGDWDITPTGETMQIGDASITSLDGGCATLEEFHTFRGGWGHGLFGFDPVKNEWRQSYIDNTGSYSTAAGGFKDGAMTFNFVEPAPPSGFGPGRVHIQRIDDQTVRLWAEHEDLAANRWVLLFDLTYHRRPGPH